MGHGEPTSIRHFVAVHSAKGGVGKSTVTANLAAALHQRGYRVAVLDADIHGPSMGLMFGDDARPERGPNEDYVFPREKHGIRFLSMANLVNEKTPIIWRGAMVHNMIGQLLNGVLWGEIDVMLVDLPPGTGDAQLSLAQAVPLAGVVVVTTPQELSLVDTVRGFNAFRQVQVPLLGIVENMAGFLCDCGHVTPVFGESSVEILAEEFEIPMLGRIPLESEVCLDSDAGVPAILAHPDSAAAKSIGLVADALIQKLEQTGAAGAFQLVWRDMDWNERVDHPPETEEVSGDLRAVWQVSNDELGLLWQDGQADVLGVRSIRLACPCAVCVDEWTGAAKLDPESVPMSLKIKHLNTVGRYALAIEFSDGHATGIYHYHRLRRLAVGEAGSES